MKDLKIRIQETVNYLRTDAGIKNKPEIAIILGTGLSALGEKIQRKKSIAYSQIPNFPVSTVPGHKGELVFGRIANREVVVMEGRFHYYEGYSPQEITYPVRVMRALGARFLLISNAAGGMNPYFDPGDLMIIEDHINLMGINPLIGPNDDSLGPRFPDMCQPYDKKLIAIAEKTALEEKIRVHKGVYVALTGPNLETRAEYRFLRIIGADAVGMSTVPEVIVGVHAGFRIFGISVITDKCLPDALKPVDFKEILETANRTEPILTRLIYSMIPKIK
ncbi:MAG TPA: purine-nucleoside phosphorylase [Candidatus Omnitrophica bacterium]|nr:purine-nucleoside phosphorylase [Candidatus Omnitrophota bacterium]